MTPKFLSKELHFLKNAADKAITPPDTFLGDQLLDKPEPLVQFESRLEEITLSQEGFLCAACSFQANPDDEKTEKLQHAFDETIGMLLSDDRGIWESINGNTYVMILWDTDEKRSGKDLFKAIQSALSDLPGVDMVTGTAVFPFREFTRTDTIANALKAADHAAFFGYGNIRKFDDISLNICGDRMYHLGRYDQAISEYQKGLTLAPGNVNLLNSLGVCHAVLGNLEQARIEI